METIREGRWPQQCLPCYRSGRRKTVSCQKIKERMHPARPQAIQVAVKGGTPFLCVEASRRKGELPWEEIAFCAGRCAGRMLLPDGIIPPDGGSVKAFLPDALAPLILFNTACDVLSRRRQPPGEECITLLDPKGRLARRQAACWPSPPWYGLSQIMPPYMSKLLSRLWRIMGRRF